MLGVREISNDDRLYGKPYITLIGNAEEIYTIADNFEGFEYTGKVLYCRQDYIGYRGLKQRRSLNWSTLPHDISNIKIIFSRPVTILIDGNEMTKTIVKCSDEEVYNPLKGAFMVWLKHFLPKEEWKNLTTFYHNDAFEEMQAATALVICRFGKSVYDYLWGEVIKNLKGDVDVS